MNTLDPAVAAERLTTWFADQIPDATEVRIEGIGRVELGHSAEMLVLTVVTYAPGEERSLDVVVRLRPPEPGLLEPYDLDRQFRVLRALQDTDVRSPAALWIEPTGEVLGRPFYVMDRVQAAVYEMEVPDDLGPAQVRRMTEELADQLATIHLVDLDKTGLRSLGDGETFLDRELDRWESDMHRVQRGSLPALERLLMELRARRPEPSPQVTLVHGDAKPGNFGFEGGEISAVFDWELVDVGDPMADVAYAEVLWSMPVGLTSRTGSLTVDEFVARYQQRTGFEVHHRTWYRAFQCYKLAVIMLLGSMLVDAGHSDDLRLAGMGLAVPFMTGLGLAEFGIAEPEDHGPVSPRAERLAAINPTG